MLKMDVSVEKQKSNQSIGLASVTNGEKLNACDQCEYTSNWSCALKEHLKTHSGEKSHKCNQCGYASFNLSNLRRHMKTHSIDKFYKCNQCSFASHQKIGLIRHMRTHINVVNVTTQPLRWAT